LKVIRLSQQATKQQLTLISEALNYTSNFHSIATQSHLLFSQPEHQALAAKPSIIAQKKLTAQQPEEDLPASLPQPVCTDRSNEEARL